MGLKEAYYGLEEKWYNFLDKINEKIPVYRLVDKIDKVIPSFLLFLIIIVLLLFLGITFLAFPEIISPQKVSFQLKVLDKSTNTPLSGVELNLSADGTTLEAGKTNALGLSPELEANEGALIDLSIEHKGYEKLARTIFISPDMELPVEITLKTEEGKDAPIRRTIQLVDKETGKLLSGEELILRFQCTKAGASPAPERTTVYTGKTIVSEPKDCGTLLVSVEGAGFNPVLSHSARGDPEIIELQADAPEESSGKLVVRAVYEGEEIDGLKVELMESVYLSTGRFGYTMYGEYVFDGIPAGSYYVSVTDPEDTPAYLPELVQVVVRAEQTATETIYMRTAKDPGNTPDKETICDNGIDDDEDGYTDLDDEDCRGIEICGNGLDDDGDGYTDFDDWEDCPEDETEICDNGEDDDGDGYIDLDDPDCVGGTEICDNGVDDDLDGYVDGDDPDCIIGPGSGYITMQVQETGINKPIDGALVSLYNDAGALIDQRTTEKDKLAKVKFLVEDTGREYGVKVEHEDYLIYDDWPFKVSDGIYVLKLTRYIPRVNGADLKVRVIDEGTGKPVIGALVSLFDEEQKPVTAKRQRVDADSNGYVTFKGIQDGTYMAYASYGNLHGWSDKGYFTGRIAEDFELVVAMVLPEGAIRVKVKDKEGEAIANAFVTFYDSADDSELETVPTNAEGVSLYTTKAGKTVYFKVTMDGYATYRGEKIGVIPNSLEGREIILDRLVVATEDKIVMEFLGLTIDDRVVEDVLAPGESYYAEFKLKVPENQSFDEIGLHFRAGKEAYMENDVVKIKTVNSTADKVMLFTKYTGNNVEEDLRSVTSEDAKWANIVWTNAGRGVTEGTYFAKIKIQVKDFASLSDTVNLYYRAWGKTGGKTVRDPAPGVVEEELYAQAKEKIYSIGEGDTLCDDRFCFNATIIDLGERLTEDVGEEPYNAELLKEYKFVFSLVNNERERIYTNATLRIDNPGEDLGFGEYSITKPNNQPVRGNAEKKSRLPLIELPDFSPNKSISGSLTFTTLNPVETGLRIRLVEQRGEGGKVVYFNENWIEIDAAKNLGINVEPETIASGIKETITVEVKDLETGLEEGDVFVKAMDKFGTILDEGFTSSQLPDRGNIDLVIPPQEPGARLKIKAEKQGFNPVEHSVWVDGNIVSFSPKKMSSSLNTAKKPSSIELLELESLVQFDLEVRSIGVTGNFRGILDTETMNNSLERNYAGGILRSGDSKEFEVGVMLSNEGRTLSNRFQMKGQVEVRLGSNESEWVFEIPLIVSVGIGGEVDEPGCLNVTQNAWSGRTEGDPITLSLEVQNNCTVDGRPVMIQDLEAKVEWESNQIGVFSFTAADTPMELRNNYYRKLVGRIEPEAKIVGFLEFTPLGGMQGTAKARVDFRARNEVEGEDEWVEDFLSTSITVNNILDCVSVSKNYLKIPVEGTDSFLVKTKECGGETRFEFESPLHLSRQEVKLPATGEQEVTVFHDSGKFPGLYPIYVKVTGAGEVSGREIQRIDAELEGIGCIRLSKYFLDIYDDPDVMYDGYDTLTVQNYCHSKEVELEFDVKSIWKAMKDAIIPTLIGVGVHIATDFIQNKLNGTKKPREADLGKNGKEKVVEPDSRGRTPINLDLPEIPESNPSLTNPNLGLTVGETDPDKHGPPGGTSSTTSTTTGETSTGSPDTKSTEEGAAISGGDSGSEETESGESPPESGVAPKESPQPTGLVSATVQPTGMFVTELLSGIPLVGNILGALPGFSTGLGPIWTGIIGFATNTVINYINQEPVIINSLQADVEIQDEWELFKQVLPEKIVEDGITVERGDTKASFVGENTVEGGETFEEIELKFINTGNLKQEDPLRPLFRVLEVTGTQFFYKHKDNAKLDEDDLEDFEEMSAENRLDEFANRLVDRTEKVDKYFNLEFLSYDESDIPVHGQGYGECRLGNKTGSTGANAVPRVKFDWRWDLHNAETGDYRCDEGNEDYIYCDATQLSTEILKKINKLVGENGVLETMGAYCPSGAICGAYSTLTLPKFFEEMEKSGEVLDPIQKEKARQLYKFNAYLIRDGYSADFQKDFHSYATTSAFFEAPEFYMGNEGLGAYFNNPSLFEFDYAAKMLSVNAPIRKPGLYEVEIEISFNDESYTLFVGGQPNAKITVHLNQKADAWPPSPFYYLPFNGRIGMDNDRIGYGVNFSGEEININNTGDVVHTSSAQGQAQVHTLETKVEDSLKALNMDKRGVILEVKRNNDELTSMDFSPSKATSVVMEIEDTGTESVYAFYTATVDGEAQNLGDNGLTKWVGLPEGENACRDFGDAPNDLFEVPDTHGSSTPLSRDLYEYGFHWNDPVKYGKVFMQTIFFTPQEAVSKLSVARKSGTLKFHTAVEENITGATTLSGFRSDEVKTVEDLFDLMEQEKVCLTDTKSEVLAEFWWNPETVAEPLEPVIQKLNIEETCIQ